MFRFALALPLLANGQISSEYDSSKALTFVQLSTAVYCDDEAVRTWSCGPACDAVPLTDVRTFDVGVNDAHAMVGVLGEQRWEGACVVSFRGTTDLQGWLFSDFASSNLVELPTAMKCSQDGRACLAGLGFLSAYLSVAKQIRGHLSELGCSDKPLHITGHSLGAAEAAIAMHDLHAHGYRIGEVYAFGQPRVGDHTFARASAKFAVKRVTRYHDPVPHLPAAAPVSAFRHMGQEIYYRHGFNSSYVQCDDGAGVSCGAGREVEIGIPASACYAMFTKGKLVKAAVVCAQLLGASQNHVKYFDDLTNHTVNGKSCKSSDSVEVLL